MSPEFNTTEIEPQPILSIRASAKTGDIAAVIGPLFGEVFNYIQQTGNHPVGMPLTIYHSMGEKEVDLECGLPVATSIAGTDRIRSSDLPGGTAATVTHIGPYSTLRLTWDALIRWMDSQGLQPASAPWEVYVTDPGADPDQSSWRTDIFFPVR